MMRYHVKSDRNLVERTTAPIVLTLIVGMLVFALPAEGIAEEDLMLQYTAAENYSLRKEVARYSWSHSFTGGGSLANDSVAVTMLVDAGFEVFYEYQRSYIFDISVPWKLHPSESSSFTVQVSNNVVSAFVLSADAWFSWRVSFDVEASGRRFFQSFSESQTWNKTASWPFNTGIVGNFEVELDPQRVFTVPISYTYSIATFTVGVSPSVAPSLFGSLSPLSGFSIQTGSALESSIVNASLTPQHSSESLELKVKDPVSSPSGIVTMGSPRSSCNVSASVNLGVILDPSVSILGRTVWQSSFYVPIGISIPLGWATGLDPPTVFELVGTSFDEEINHARLADTREPIDLSLIWQKQLFDPNFYKISITRDLPQTNIELFSLPDRRGLMFSVALTITSIVILFSSYVYRGRKGERPNAPEKIRLAIPLLLMLSSALSLLCFYFIVLSPSRYNLELGPLFAIGFFVSMIFLALHVPPKHAFGITAIASSIALLIGSMLFADRLGSEPIFDQSLGFPMVIGGFPKPRIPGDFEGYSVIGAPVAIYLQEALRYTWAIPLALFCGAAMPFLIRYLLRKMKHEPFTVTGGDSKQTFTDTLFSRAYLLVPGVIFLSMVYVVVVYPAIFSDYVPLGVGILGVILLAVGVGGISAFLFSYRIGIVSFFGMLVILMLVVNFGRFSVAAIAPSVLSESIRGPIGDQVQTYSGFRGMRIVFLIPILVFVVWYLASAIFLGSQEGKIMALLKNIESLGRFLWNIDIYERSLSSGLALIAVVALCLTNLWIGFLFAGMTGSVWRESSGTFSAEETGVIYPMQFSRANSTELVPGDYCTETVRIPDGGTATITVHSNGPVYVREFNALGSCFLDQKPTREFYEKRTGGGVINLLVRNPTNATANCRVTYALAVSSAPGYYDFAAIYFGCLILLLTMSLLPRVRSSLLVFPETLELASNTARKPEEYRKSQELKWYKKAETYHEQHGELPAFPDRLIKQGSWRAYVFDDLSQLFYDRTYSAERCVCAVCGQLDRSPYRAVTRQRIAVPICRLCGERFKARYPQLYHKRT